MKGAIFDIDGTILDSMTIWTDITDEFFKSHGVAITPEENAAYQQLAFEESLLAIHRDYLSDIPVEEMLDEFSHIAAKAYKNTIQPKPYVCQYIKKLHDSGVKLAVATSGFDELVEAAFKRIGIFDYFSAFAYSAEVGCSKSSPDIYLLAAKRLDLKPQECTVYEDIITGIMSAKNAGFMTVSVADLTNAGDKDRLILCSVRYITGWDELLSNIS